MSKVKSETVVLESEFLSELNSKMKKLIELVEGELHRARAIQKAVIPAKFPKIPGLKTGHKYLSGLKSGGDYLDVFEFEDKVHVGILMSDSSGYGLSAAFLSVILKLALKFLKEEVSSPSAVVKRIAEELQLTMKPKDELSLFYGILNRKTLDLKFTGCGSIRLFLNSHEKAFKSSAIKKNEDIRLADQTVGLEANSRLVLLSDGFANAIRSGRHEEFLAERADQEVMELVNEFNYAIKKELSEEDMPEQDCSILVIDVLKNAMRLAK